MPYRALLTATVSAFALIACSPSEPATAPPAEQTTSKPSAPATQNTLLAEWSGPYGGVPAFDAVSLDQLRDALNTGMQQNLAEIDAITANTDPATFENTILELEKSGETLGRVFTFYGIWGANLSSPEFREIQSEMAPKLSEFNSKITQNDALFQRVKAVYESEALQSMRPDQQRLVQLTYDGFARNGATLNAADKARYAAINKRLSELHTKFASNVLHLSLIHISEPTRPY